MRTASPPRHRPLPAAAGFLVAWLAVAAGAADPAPPLPDAPSPAPGEVGGAPPPAVTAPEAAETVTFADGSLFRVPDTDARRYFAFDVLGLQRDYHVPDGPLVVENVTPTFTALET